MSPARRHSSPTVPSRRTLLRGGLAFGAAASTAAVTGVPASARSGSPLGATYPGTEWIPAHSSNYTSASRPAQYPVRFVIVHVTQGSYAGTLQHFRNPKAKVSAHYVIRSGDGHIAQTVREKDVGWHAGNWDYNLRSIGIEHEGLVDDPKWFTDAMYKSSAALTAAVCDRYAIPKTRQHIIGHNEVPGADHTDPGKFWDWTRYMRLIAAA